MREFPAERREGKPVNLGVDFRSQVWNVLLLYQRLLLSQARLFCGNKGPGRPSGAVLYKVLSGAFHVPETLEHARSVFRLPLDISEKVAGWLHEKTLGHPYFLACICKHLMATEKQIEAHKLETTWPAILDQLGREKFRSDVSKLSAKELELIHHFASLDEGEVSADHFGGKFQREYFARLVGKIPHNQQIGSRRTKFYLSLCA
jgi:hypothetical protein